MLSTLGSVHVERGESARARAFLADGLQLAWANGELPTALRCVAGFAAWHAAEGRVADAIAWLTAAHAHPAVDRADAESKAGLLAKWLATVPPEEAEAAQARGRRLDLDEVVAEALALA